jgi:hypothetical protein
MRKISLPVFYKATLPPTLEDFDEAHELRQVAGRIVASAAAIEEAIVQIISATLLKEVQIHKELIVGSILKSDWCSFASKKKLLLLAVETFSLIEGKLKTDLESELSKVMKYRNAFAHGSLVHNTDAHELHYFENKPKTARLDDEYFQKLEQLFQRVWGKLQQIQEQLVTVDSI